VDWKDRLLLENGFETHASKDRLVIGSVGLLFIILGVFLQYQTAWKPLSDTRSTQSWIATEAVVGKVVTQKGEGNFRLTIYYSYVVDDVIHTGSRYSAEYDHRRVSQSDLTEVQVEYAEGNTLEIYYKPEDPTQTVIHRDHSWEVYPSVFGSIIFIALGGLALTSALVQNVGASRRVLLKEGITKKAQQCGYDIHLNKKENHRRGVIFTGSHMMVVRNISLAAVIYIFLSIISCWIIIASNVGSAWLGFSIQLFFLLMFAVTCWMGVRKKLSSEALKNQPDYVLDYDFDHDANMKMMWVWIGEGAIPRSARMYLTSRKNKSETLELNQDSSKAGRGELKIGTRAKEGSIDYKVMPIKLHMETVYPDGKIAKRSFTLIRQKSDD